MALHYLDPEREPRECHRCNGAGNTSTGHGAMLCGRCNGTGRLGDPEARRVEVAPHPCGLPRFVWRRFDPIAKYQQPWEPDNYPTEAAALEAARIAAAKRVG